MDFEKEENDKVAEIKDDEYWKNNYISVQMWKMDAEMEGRAMQKAEDEKLIAKKDAEIARLKKLLAAKG